VEYLLHRHLRYTDEAVPPAARGKWDGRIRCRRIPRW
jgi:hypothetical protein